MFSEISKRILLACVVVGLAGPVAAQAAGTQADGPSSGTRLLEAARTLAGYAGMCYRHYPQTQTRDMIEELIRITGLDAARAEWLRGNLNEYYRIGRGTERAETLTAEDCRRLIQRAGANLDAELAAAR